MKLAALVDSSGFFVEDVIVDEDSPDVKILDGGGGYVTISAPNGLYKPRFDLTAFLDGSKQGASCWGEGLSPEEVEELKGKPVEESPKVVLKAAIEELESIKKRTISVEKSVYGLTEMML